MENLWVRLGETLYRVDRPFGELEAGLKGCVSDVSVNAQGHVFVLLRRDPVLTGPSPSVVELAPDGRFLRAWGNDIADAHMLACHPSTGEVYVVDRDAHEVRRYSPDGVYRGSLGKRHRPGEPFSHPTDVAFMQGGQIVVTDGYGNARVHVFSAEGKLLHSFGSLGTAPAEFLTPHSVCILNDDRIVVVDRENHRLQIFNVNGQLFDIWEGFFRPQSVWCDGVYLYVTDSVPSLSQLSLSGDRVSRCRPVLNGAHGLHGDLLSGCLFLAEGSPSRVTRLIPEAGNDIHVV